MCKCCHGCCCGASWCDKTNPESLASDLRWEKYKREKAEDRLKEERATRVRLELAMADMWRPRTIIAPQEDKPEGAWCAYLLIGIAIGMIFMWWIMTWYGR